MSDDGTKLSQKAVAEILGNEAELQRATVPHGWRVHKMRQAGADYFNDTLKLAAALNATYSRDGNIIVHVAVRRMDGCRPSAFDMATVKRALMDNRKGRIVENNQLLKTSELTRNLWQVVEQR